MATTASSTHRLPLYVLLALILFGGALRLYYFNPDLGRTPDERTYTRQANIVRTQGAAGFHFLGRELAADLPTVSLYPSPLRVGYITLLAAFMQITGDASPLAGAHLSLFCSLLSLCLIAVLAWRVLSHTTAIIATLFFAVFPFDLVVSRRAWQESFIALLTIAMLALAILIVRTNSGRRLVSLAAFSFLGFLALTTKENAGLTFLLCAAGVILHFLLQHNRRAAMLTAASAAIALLAYVAVLGSLFGGVAHGFFLVRECARVSSFNPYDVQYDSGPVWMFPAGLFRTSPLVSLAAIAGLIATLIRPLRARSLTNAGLPLGIALLATCILLIQILTQRYSFRYTAPVYGSLCLLAGIGAAVVLPALQRLLAPLGRTATWAILCFVIAVAACHDLNFARENLILPELPDLALRPILGVPPASLP